MASAIQIHGRVAPSARKRKRTIIKPLCVGSILVVMYGIFIFLVLVMLGEEGRVMDSGAAHHLFKSVTRGGRGGNSGNGAASSSSSSKQRIESSDNNNNKSGQKSSPSADDDDDNNNNNNNNNNSSEHPDLIHFCGECRWKDTPHTCDERVAWEMEHRPQKTPTEYEAKKRNLLYCTKPDESHISDLFCGECPWKDVEDLDCNTRVAWEVENKKLTVVEARKRNLPYCRRPPYILSPLCGHCVKDIVSNATSKMFRTGTPCYDIMIRRMKHGLAKTATDAARLVADEFPECRRCHPETCWKSYFDEMNMNATKFLDDADEGYLTKYWRFDRAAPKITSPTTLVLPSIPKEFRIPPSRFADIEAFLTEKYRAFEGSNDTKHVEIFIEYNPGLAPVPHWMKRYLPRYSAYVVAFRVTPANNCFRREDMVDLPQKVWEHTMMSATNLLGIAILDEDYEMLKGYDVVVDIATQLGFQKDGYGTTYFGEPTFMDYRLFTLNEQVYLHANADVTVVTKLDLRMKEYARKPREGQFELDNVYGGDNLVITMLHQFNTIWSGGDRGKNFALFSVPNSTHPNAPDSVYAEVNINPYHKVQQIYLDEVEMLKRNYIKKRIRRNYAVDKIMMRKVKTNGNVTTSDIEPSPSFFTVDEHWFPGHRSALRRAGHGGACCVSLSREEALAQGGHINLATESWGDENDYLLVGLAHTSVVWRRWYKDPVVPESEKAMIPHTHYVSFFYAFEPRPPFNLRARSGYFCLGFAEEDGTEGGMFNPHSTLTTNRKLSQHNETFSCGQIHFISSFIEKVGDSSQTVVGYGINDCTSRLVEVSKKEIARMLFSDPWDMKIEKSKEMRKKMKPYELQTQLNW